MPRRCGPARPPGCTGSDDPRRTGPTRTTTHAAAAERDLTEFRELDFTFHRAVIEARGNAYLPRMWDIIEPSLRSLHVLGDPEFSGDWHEVAEWHRSLLDHL